MLKKITKLRKKVIETKEQLEAGKLDSATAREVAESAQVKIDSFKAEIDLIRNSGAIQ